MNVVTYAYLVVADLLSIAFGFMVLDDLALKLSRRPDGSLKTGNFGMVLVIILTVFTASISIVTVAFMSIGATITIVSTFAFMWVSFAYFLIGRFYPKAERPMIFLRLPFAVPVVLISFFLISAITMGFFLKWYLCLLPIPIWVIIGYVSAEIAIRRDMRFLASMGEAITDSSRPARLSAIQYVNRLQGRDSQKYPFP